MKRLPIIAIALMAVACSDHPAPPVPPQAAQAVPAVAASPAQPVIVNNHPAADSGIKDMLLGGALGYMMGSASGTHAAAMPAQQVVERRYYVRERAVPPAPAAAPPAPAPVAAAVPASPPPKAAPATPPAVKPFAYGAPPAPTPKVTYGSGFSQFKAAPAPRPSPPSYTSRPGSYSSRR